MKADAPLLNEANATDWRHPDGTRVTELYGAGPYHWDIEFASPVYLCDDSLTPQSEWYGTHYGELLGGVQLVYDPLPQPAQSPDVLAATADLDDDFDDTYDVYKVLSPQEGWFTEGCNYRNLDDAVDRAERLASLNAPAEFLVAKVVAVSSQQSVTTTIYL